MAETKPSGFKLNQVTITDFSINREPRELGQIKIDIDPKGYVDHSNTIFMLNLDVKLSDDVESFKVYLRVLGRFEFSAGDENVDNYFYTNAPALVFPYVRTYIQGVTALSGLPAITIPLMNLTQLGSILKKNIEAINA